MTIMEALKWASEELKKTADLLDSPMLDAEVLLSHILGVSKSWLFTHFDEPLRKEDAYREMIIRRATGEPVAYLTGKKDFYGRPFAVNRTTLIPRPETEQLVELALNEIDQEEQDQTLLADIGAGSGAIAVTLAAETNLPVIATDISRDALDVAKQNAATHNVSEIDFREGDLAEPLLDLFRALKEKDARPFRHLIICANLPYLTEEQWAHTQTAVKEYEPKTALTAGADGLDAYWNLFRQLKSARHVLPFRVTAIIEIDPSQRASASELIKHTFPLANPIIHKDLANKDRFIAAEL